MKPEMPVTTSITPTIWERIWDTVTVPPAVVMMEEQGFAPGNSFLPFVRRIRPTGAVSAVTVPKFSKDCSVPLYTSVLGFCDVV